MEVLAMNSSLHVTRSNRSRSGAGRGLAALATPTTLLGLLLVLGVGQAVAYGAETASGAVRPPAPVTATTGHEPFPLVTANDAGDVRLAIADFADGAAHFYTFMANGLPVEFFVVHTPDNVIRSAFDACDICYHAKLGYRWDGAVMMVCNNCGNRFATEQIGIARGGCNPAPLAARIDGDHLVIAAQDLVAGLRYFP
jgi:uncharacterized membrane protein